eukprot:1807390-Prorocentrum_lima.AAC.1
MGAQTPQQHLRRKAPTITHMVQAGSASQANGCYAMPPPTLIPTTMTALPITSATTSLPHPHPP